MRTLAFAGLAAFMAIAPSTAESAPGSGHTVMTRDWGSVPNIPLRPPVTTMPAPGGGSHMGNWSSGGGWRGGQGRWHQAGPGGWHATPPAGHGNWGQWRGGRGKFAGFHPRRGIFLPRFFVSPTFFVTNWWNFGLAQPGYGQQWVRYYDDAVLIDDRGYIIDTAPNVAWDGSGRDDDRYDDRDSDWGPHPVYRNGSTVYYAPPGSTTVIVQSAPVITTTTTTTTYVDEVVRAPRRAWKPRRQCHCK
jgi:hypothetical protein